MIEIGITGSLASGKSTFSKYLSENKHPLFNADKAVKRLYKDKVFIKRLMITFKLRNNKNIKKSIKNIIEKNNYKIRKLESLIHPRVRKEMKNLANKKINSKIVIFEIPLLIESKLMKFFDTIVFVEAPRIIRLSRYLKKGGNKRIFDILDKRQAKPEKKARLSNVIIHNNKSLLILKKNASKLLKKYE